jgi:hydroxymethylbilane synthase
VKIATRGSALALAQSGWVADQLPGEHELVTVTTSGDRGEGPDDKARWVDAVERALLDGEADLAVHSAKDVPAQLAPGTVLLGSPPREDPRDAMVLGPGGGLCHDIAELREGARVGTASLRRRAQLLAARPDLEIVELRGNVDTRLRKVASGEVDAVVLAAAGLARLGRLHEAAETLDPGQMLPAPGQGALAVECRSDDDALRSELAGLLDDVDTRAAVSAERRLLAALEAGCTAPVGALADIGEGDSGQEIYLRAVVVSLDGTRALRMSITGPVANGDELATRLATQMLEEGAADLIGENP